MVSSQRAWVWVPAAPRGYLRAAGRPKPEKIESLFTEVIGEIASFGIAHDWGNVHPLTAEGIRAACDYVAFYGSDDLDIAVPPGFDPLEYGLDLIDCVEVNWLPPNTVVVLPGDKRRVGTFMVMGDKVFAYLLDPSRTIAIARK